MSFFCPNSPNPIRTRSHLIPFSYLNKQTHLHLSCVRKITKICFQREWKIFRVRRRNHLHAKGWQCRRWKCTKCASRRRGPPHRNSGAASPISSSPTTRSTGSRIRRGSESWFWGFSFSSLFFSGARIIVLSFSNPILFLGSRLQALLSRRYKIKNFKAVFGRWSLILELFVMDQSSSFIR